MGWRVEREPLEEEVVEEEERGAGWEEEENMETARWG